MPADDQGDGPACCLPGDITVTAIYSGFLIGLVLDPKGPGPWWEYIAVVEDERVALHQAATLARMHGTRAFRHIGTDQYEPIPLVGA